jgi:hypothetical protein
MSHLELGFAYDFVPVADTPFCVIVIVIAADSSSASQSLIGP